MSDIEKLPDGVKEAAGKQGFSLKKAGLTQEAAGPTPKNTNPDPTTPTRGKSKQNTNDGPMK